MNMNPELYRRMNYIGLAIWLVLFWVLIPFNIIKKFPLVIVGYIYTVMIIIANIKLIGNYENIDMGNDLRETSTSMMKYINDKAVQVSAATFTVALIAKDIFKITFYKDLIYFMIFTMVFGVGINIPIFLVMNQKNELIKNKYNKIIAIVHNISLSYSVGFMICTFMILINKVYLYK